MATAADSLDRQQLDRAVWAMTGVVWTAQLLLVLTQFAAFSESAPAAAVWARIASSAAGLLACLALHAWAGPRRGERPGKALARVALLTPLACLAVTVVSEIVYLQFPEYIRERFDLTISQLLRNQDGVLVRGVASIFFGYVWVFTAWTAFYGSALHAVADRTRERQLAEAEAAAQRAQLMALQLQINPHFLFNALNALAALIDLDRRAEAARMVVDLSSFLRSTLTSKPEQKITLADECAAQTRYLTLEQVRFGDRLRVELQPLGDLAPALVPSLILQPLVENAVKYAVQPSLRPVTVTVSARREGGSLVVAVADSGGAPDPGALPTPGAGIGLGNVRERLRAFYGEEARLDSGPALDGYRAEIRLPLELSR